MRYKNLKVSFEAFPPVKDKKIGTVYDTVKNLVELNPEFISVTYGAGGTIKSNKTIELASYIKNNFNIESLAHLTCISSTKEDIDMILSELKKNNVNNILALRGDKTPELDNGNDFFHAVDLVKYIKQKGDFKVYTACYPEGHLEAESIEKDVERLKEKVDAGTDELITQLFFDNKFLYDFIDKIKKYNINIPIHAGIMPVTNIKSIMRMTIMCGTSLPRKLMQLLSKYQFSEEDVRKAGIEYSINQIEDLSKNGIEHVHIYTMNDPDIARAILG